MFSTTPAKQPEQLVCCQLSGEKYKNYIERTRTRSLGGVSLKLRGRIIRQLFPYKPFPTLKAGDEDTEAEVELGQEQNTSSSIVQVKMEVPEDGNKLVLSTEWTDEEKRKHDEKMYGWARWEVDIGLGVIRSTKCSKLTTNPDGICAECRAVSNDESLKSDIRKVIVSHGM